MIQLDEIEGCCMRVELHVLGVPQEYSPTDDMRLLGIVTFGPGHSIVHLREHVKEKIAQVLFGCEFSFTMWHNGNYVVDEAYYDELLMRLVSKRREIIAKTAAPAVPSFGTQASQTDLAAQQPLDTVYLTVHVKVTAAAAAAPPQGPRLTASALRSLDVQGSRAPKALVHEEIPFVAIRDVNMKLHRGQWKLEAEVIRWKTFPSGAYMVLQSLTDAKETITATTWEPSVVRWMVEQLKPQSIVIIENAVVKMRLEQDRHEHEDTHDYKLLLDNGTKLSSRSNKSLAAPRVIAFGAADARALVSFPSSSSSSAAAVPFYQPKAHDSCSSLSTVMKGKRTMFTSNSGTAKAPSGGPVPQSHIPAEPLLAPNDRQCLVTSADTRKRDRIVDEHDARRSTAQKILLRRARMASDKCLLCNVDLSSQRSIDELTERLKLVWGKTASKLPLEEWLPTDLELRDAFRDKTGKHDSSASGSSSGRFCCHRAFLDPFTNTVHRVHARCAHVATLYQRGSSMEDVLLDAAQRQCSLCMQPGAVVLCYYPDCRLAFHSSCAVLSHGYVNFGIRDPIHPVAACPCHTQVRLPGAQTHCRVERQDGSGVGVVDSSVIIVDELRDPDDREEDSSEEGDDSDDEHGR